MAGRDRDGLVNWARGVAVLSGLDFSLVEEGDLMRVDDKGVVLEHGRYRLLNYGAFTMHPACCCFPCVYIV